jgi:hypothetical protein
MSEHDLSLLQVLLGLCTDVRSAEPTSLAQLHRHGDWVSGVCGAVRRAGLPLGSADFAVVVVTASGPRQQLEWAFHELRRTGAPAALLAFHRASTHANGQAPAA